MFCQGIFIAKPKELAFCDSHSHASQSQKVTRPGIILYAYKEAHNLSPQCSLP